MSDFKIIYRVDNSDNTEDKITWEQGCPLIFEAIQISRNTKTGEAFLQGKLRNLTDQTIQSFRANVVITYEDSIIEKISFNPLDADIAATKTYLLEPVKLSQGNAIKAVGVIEQVKATETIWNTSSEASDVPKPTHIGLSSEAITERYNEIWGTIKSREPQAIAANKLEQHDNWWLCPCGQLNVQRDTCLKCHAALDKLQDANLENESSLINAANERAKEKAKQEEEQKKVKEKRIKFAKKYGSIAAGLIIAIALLFVFVIKPIINQTTYDQASNDFDSGNYQQAYEKFEGLGAYSDAPSRAQEAQKLAVFYDKLDPFLKDKSQAATYFDGKYKTTIYGKDCEITLNKDLTVVLHIPQSDSPYDDWSGVFSVNSGDWKGTIDPFKEQLSLPGYPGGEIWNIKFNERTLKYSNQTVSVLDFENVNNGQESGYHRSFSVKE